MEMRQDMEQGQYPYVECAIHSEQIDTIRGGVGRIETRLDDMGRDLKVIAAHAEAIGDLKRRMGLVEGQLNWGKWILAIVAGTTALVTFLQGMAQGFPR